MNHPKPHIPAQIQKSANNTKSNLRPWTSDTGLSTTDLRLSTCDLRPVTSDLRPTKFKIPPHRHLIAYLLFPIVIFLTPLNVSAQFLHFSMKVQPELSANVVRDLDFGTAVSGSGRQQIDLGDPNMGIYSITGSQSQKVLIQVDIPDELTGNRASNNTSIPLNIQMTYNNKGENDYVESVPIQGTTAEFPIKQYALQNFQTQGMVWETAYLYIFGSLDVENVPDDVYTGEITLVVEYE